MQFKKYMHIEKLGNTEVEGIENGLCYVFPKLDGSNAQVFTASNGEICSGSRKRVLSSDNDNQGFHKFISEQSNIKRLLLDFTTIRLFGEWLVPHTLKTYRDDAWNKFYVFDIELDGELLRYGECKVILDDYNIEYIPPLCKIENPTQEKLISFLEKNDYLIKDGNGIGEGIVIKNYDFFNKYGRRVWAKIVTNDFKSKHRKSNDVQEIKEKQIIEKLIAEKYVDDSLVNKVYANIINQNDGWGSKNIPQLLNTVFYDLIREESWSFLKEHKFPVINYGKLKLFVVARVKEVKSELF